MERMYSLKIVNHLMLIILIGLSIKHTINHFNYMPHNDLRNRLVSSRLLADGKDAYAHQWTVNDGDRLHDPFIRPNEIVNGCTVPPTALQTFSFLNDLDWLTVKKVWILLSYFFAFLTLWLIIETLPTHQQYLGFLSSAFLITRTFYYHLHSGQLYLFYAFLLALALYGFFKNKLLIFVIALAVLIALRPIAIVLTIPLFFTPSYHKKIFYSYLLAGVLITLSILTVGSKQWLNYKNSMALHALEQTKGIPQKQQPTVLLAQIEGFEAAPPINQEYINSITPQNTSVQALLNGVGITTSTKGLMALYGLIIIALLLLLFFFDVSLSVEKLLALGFFALLIFEYFLPAPRFSYNMLQWLALPLVLYAVFKNNSVLISLTAFSVVLWAIANSFTFAQTIIELIWVGLLLVALFFKNPIAPQTELQHQ
jgi:hypothetical protein